MAITYTAKSPSQTTGGKTYATALSNWLAQQKQAQEQYQSSLTPLQETVNMFQQGGSYGQGQRNLYEQQAKEAQASALASQVASGMSSGSLASATAMRAKNDLATNLAGVEDTRTTFLNKALQTLSTAMQTQAAATAYNATNPYYDSYMSYLSNLINTQSQEAQAVQQANLQAALAKHTTKNNNSNTTSTYNSLNY